MGEDKTSAVAGNMLGGAASARAHERALSWHKESNSKAKQLPEPAKGRGERGRGGGERSGGRDGERDRE